MCVYKKYTIALCLEFEEKKKYIFLCILRRKIDDFLAKKRYALRAELCRGERRFVLFDAR